MAETERERQLLRGLLAEGHRSTRRRTPAFAALWSRAVAEMRSPPEARRRGLALAAAAAALLALATTVTLWRARPQDPVEVERAMQIAATVSEWRAPLDFLLETPGREWLESTPGWPVEPTDRPWNLTPDLLEPDSLQPDSLQEITQ